MRTRLLLSVLCVVGLLAPAHAEVPAMDSLIAMTLEPARVEMGTFCSTVDVLVTAEIPKCDGAVLLLQGPDEEIKLNTKGRVAGIWLNVSQMKVSNVPQFYILAQSDSLEKLCDPECLASLGVGTDFLLGRMDFSSEGTLQGWEREEFLRLKKRGGTYKLGIAITLAPSRHEWLQLTAKLPISPSCVAGTYPVTMYCFDGGIPVHRATASLSIERTGLAQFMSGLARAHAGLYGVLAIVVAVVVGLGMGIIFTSRTGGRR